MKKEDVKRFIENNDSLKNYIKGGVGCIEYKICGVPIIIYKENRGVEPYYKLPYNPNYNYEKVVEFMRYAIPILSEMLEAEREKKLHTSNSI